MKTKIQLKNSNRIIEMLIIPDEEQILITNINGDIIVKISFQEMYNDDGKVNTNLPLSGLFTTTLSPKEEHIPCGRPAEYYGTI